MRPSGHEYLWRWNNTKKHGRRDQLKVNGNNPGREPPVDCVLKKCFFRKVDHSVGVTWSDADACTQSVCFWMSTRSSSKYVYIENACGVPVAGAAARQK